MNQVRLLPLGEEDPCGRGELQLDNQFPELVTRETVRQLVIERQLVALLGLLLALQRLETFAPSGQQSIKDLVCHEAVEACASLAAGLIPLVPKVIAESGHAKGGDGGPLVEAVEGP